MPELSREVKHHPSSVNNLLIQQLLDVSNTKTLFQFFTTELAGIKKPIAQRIIAELAVGDKSFSEDMRPKNVTSTQVNR